VTKAAYAGLRADRHIPGADSSYKSRNHLMRCAQFLRCSPLPSPGRLHGGLSSTINNNSGSGFDFAETGRMDRRRDLRRN
jgi:hypothetical protein